MSKVIVLCGKVASGKSYYAREIQDKTKAIILSVDDLMLALSDSCLGDRHDDIARRCERYFYGLAEKIIRTGEDVIIDFGYWSKEERKEAKEYFMNRNILVELHYIKTEDSTRKRQLVERNHRLANYLKDNPKERVYIIGDELLFRLDNKFEEPSEGEADLVIT